MTYSPDIFERMGEPPAAPPDDQPRRRTSTEDQRINAEDDRAERIANASLQPSFMSLLAGEEDDDLSEELAELEEPITFDAEGVCTKHVSPCPRFLCPRNLMFDFGTPFIDSNGKSWAPVTLNTGVEEDRRGRRSSWTVKEQAKEENWTEMSNVALDRFEALRLAAHESPGAGEICASFIALGIRRMVEAFEAEIADAADGLGDVDPDTVRRAKLEKRAELDELTVVQLAAKMGVSDETLRLLTVESFAKVRAAAAEGGWKPTDGFDAFAVIEAVLTRG